MTSPKAASMRRGGGYSQMLEMIKGGSIGAVFISEVSRGGRNDQAWLAFLELLATHDVLLFENGVATDPNDDDQVFVKKIQALTVFRENKMRTVNLHRGRLAKARARMAVTAPPAGYVPQMETRDGIPVKTGAWIKDPDPAVRGAVDAIFRAFRQARSLSRAVKLLNAWEVRVPARRGACSLRFSRPTVANLRRFINEAAYTGCYVYGREHWRRVQAGGEPVPPHRPIGQFVEVRDHHDGYITYEEYLENLKILAMNRRQPRHYQLGPGPALLQGICRCGRHERIMSVHYQPTARGMRWGLRCIGDHLNGGKQCISVPASAIEEAVTQAVLDHLDVDVMHEAECLWKQRRRAWQREHASTSAELRKQTEKVDRLRRMIVEDEGSRPNVRDMLDDEYEQAARTLDAMRQRAAIRDEVLDPFCEARWQDLFRLCMDRVAIWNAPTTTDQDRKQLIRILVETLTLEHVDVELVRIRIEWCDGTPGISLEIRRTGYFHRMILEMHVAGKEVDEIVQALRQVGARTRQGREWCRATVAKTLSILKRRNS